MTGSILILGGVRSGKSAFAERLGRRSGLDLVYLATAEAWDDEMRARIARHRADRSANGWRTVEEPLELAAVIECEAAPTRFLLIDCLTLWLTNLMMAKRDVAVATDGLVATLDRIRSPIALVSNEVGMGGIAAAPMARAFADHAGRLHQAMAAVVEEVVLIAAGLPLWLKRTGEP